MATTYVKTWQMNINAAMDSGSSTLCCKNIAWQMKAILKGDVTLKDVTASTIGSPAGLWTHYASSDASTAGIDSTDRWLTSYDSSKLTNASSGNAHSWITLKSPNSFGGISGNLYLTIDLSNTLPTINFALSRTAPTSASTTARVASSSDEMTFATAVTTAGVTAAKAHGGITSDGSFYFLASQNTSGVFFFQSAVLALLEAKSADNFPYVWLSGSATTAVNETFARAIIAQTTPAMCQSRDRNNLTTVNPSLPMWAIAQSSTGIFAQMTTTDATDGNYDDLPIYVFVNRAGFYTLKGRLPDIRWAPESASQGTVEPTAGTPQSMIVSNVWIPTYVAPSL